MKLLLLSWQRTFLTAAAAFLVMLSNAGHAQVSSAFPIVITQPEDHATFTAPANVQIDASIYEPLGRVAYVLFSASPPDGTYAELGVISNGVSLDPPRTTYVFDWTNVPAGKNWSLIATAVRSNGTEVVSAPVQITVRNNYSLSVDIASPTNGATFPGPTSIDLIAVVVATNDAAAFVEFFNGSQPLGVVSNWAVVDPPGSPGLPPGSRAYFFDWTNQSLGSHVITATATDTNGSTVSSAPVTIIVGSATNLPPIVLITQPTNGSTFIAPTNVQFDVSVYDPAGDAASVSFVAFPSNADFAILLGVVSNWVSLNPATRIYTFDWSNALTGTWSIEAGVVRSNGTPVGSAVVHIAVERMNGTNLPPIVRITSPPNRAVFRAPVNVALLAYAQEANADGSVQSVEFFAGSNNLGFGQPVPIALPVDPGGPMIPTNTPSPILLTNTFELIWSNAPPGAYALTALATEDDGGSATSAPVNITIQPAPPPPTNLPDIVNIAATDPIAIAGTNCWAWLGGPLTWSNWMSPTAVWRWYTNCGPIDATFSVRRRGSTNSDLTVNYAIGGTATNGFDYVTLPGSVTIPAGQAEAAITVVPIDDGASNISSTVILALKPTTNSSVDYVLGFPRSSEAIIIDSIGLRLEPGGTMLPDRSFHLCLTGPDGAWFHVDYTTNLADWTPVCTNQVINGSIDFVDPDAATSPAREYRAVPMANPPSD